jgi:hypothetical protein
MASSPADPTPTPKAFALRELAACWNQAYEAMAQGDLDRVASLLDVADDHLPPAGAGAGDDALESTLRNDALMAKARLEHGMQAGLPGMRDEMARARVGSRALRGYAQATGLTKDLLT